MSVPTKILDHWDHSSQTDSAFSWEYKLGNKELEKKVRIIK